MQRGMGQLLSGIHCDGVDGAGPSSRGGRCPACVGSAPDFASDWTISAPSKAPAGWQMLQAARSRTAMPAPVCNSTKTNGQSVHPIVCMTTSERLAEGGSPTGPTICISRRRMAPIHAATAAPTKSWSNDRGCLTGSGLRQHIEGLPRAAEQSVRLPADRGSPYSTARRAGQFRRTPLSHRA